MKFFFFENSNFAQAGYIRYSTSKQMSKSIFYLRIVTLIRISYTKSKIVAPGMVRNDAVLTRIYFKIMLSKLKPTYIKSTLVFT